MRYAVYNSEGVESYDRDFSTEKEAILYYNNIIEGLKNDLFGEELLEEVSTIRVDKVDDSQGFDWSHIGLDGSTVQRLRGE